MMQPELLQPSWPYYNIIDSSPNEIGVYGLDMDAHMGDCEFSSSFATTEDSSDVSSIQYFSTFYSDNQLNVPFFDDHVEVMFPIEQYSPNLEDFDPILNDYILSDGVEDMCGWMESEGSPPSQQTFIEEEDEGSLSPSMNSSYLDMSSVQPSLVLPTEDMEIDNQLSILHLLTAYGDAMEKEQAELAEVILRRITEKVSPAGTTVERLAYYLFQALDKQGDYLKQESSKNFESAFRAFYQIFPYGRFAHFTANSAILEAMPNDAEMIHIIDFDMGEGIQWPPMIEALGGQGRVVRLTSVKWKDCGSIPPQWRFEETKRRLYDHAQSSGLVLKVEEMEMEELVSEISKMKRGREREWLAFNCMVGLPHMGRQRSRRHVMEFLKVAEKLISNPTSGSTSNRGIVTFGDGDGVGEKMGNYCGFGPFFDGFLLQFNALFESMKWHFPIHLTEARIAMECLFLAPSLSSLSCFQKWEEIREGCGVHSGIGLKGWRVSKQNLVEAKEMVKEGGESLYSVRVEGENENQMVLEWRGTPLVGHDPKFRSAKLSAVAAHENVHKKQGRWGGHGFAFTVSPSKQFPGAEPGHFLGIFNSSNDGNSSNHVFAVEFDTVNGFGEYADSNGNHIGINVNSMSSIASEPASYHVGNSEVMEEVDMKSGKPIQSWIEYDGVDKMVHVTISYFSIPKPSRPILSHPIDLSTVLKDSMYVGFSASTGKLSSFHYILGWSFRTNLNPYPLNNSLLPSPPREVMDSPFKLKTGAIIAVVLSVTTFVVLIFNLSINMKACSDQCLHLRRVQRRSLARSIPANSLLAPIFVDQDLTSGLSAASYQSGDLLYPAIFESKRTSLRVLLLVSYISQYLSRCHSLSGNSSALK
ncbi:hypothetical protein HHK36_018609 [Tetracentron sinense]|uniref:Legume lectin domain-containing protein n=1 Tax=Tetracentron sinense TaxID=13715 RepID=A0A834YZ52_TETSI|nr:hypothetical protein HHK36_018609 [Tetracentron sinense]